MHVAMTGAVQHTEWGCQEAAQTCAMGVSVTVTTTRSVVKGRAVHICSVAPLKGFVRPQL